MNRSNLLRILFTATLLATTSQATLACSVTPDNGVIEINSLPVRISAPGHYCLKVATNNQYNYSGAYGPIISVETDFAIIDLNGQTITNYNSNVKNGIYYTQPQSGATATISILNGTFTNFHLPIEIFSNATLNNIDATVENIAIHGGKYGIIADSLYNLDVSNVDIDSVVGIDARDIERFTVENAIFRLTAPESGFSASAIQLFGVNQSSITNVDIFGNNLPASNGILGSGAYGRSNDMTIKKIRGYDLSDGITYGADSAGIYSETIFTNTISCYVGGTKGKFNLCRRTQ